MGEVVFQKGDKVICHEPGSFNGLEKDKEYTVEAYLTTRECKMQYMDNVTEPMVKLEGLGGRKYARRFTLASAFTIPGDDDEDCV